MISIFRDRRPLAQIGGLGAYLRQCWATVRINLHDRGLWRMRPVAPPCDLCGERADCLVIYDPDECRQGEAITERACFRCSTWAAETLTGEPIGKWWRAR